MFLSSIIFARPRANWQYLFGKRFKTIRLEVSTLDKKKSISLTSLDTFPCYNDSYWRNSDFKVKENRRAFIKIHCIYPPESVRFAFKDKKKKKSALGRNSEVDGIMSCLINKSEKNKFKINIEEDCYEEVLPDSFTENK